MHTLLTPERQRIQYHEIWSSKTMTGHGSDRVLHGTSRGILSGTEREREYGISTSESTCMYSVHTMSGWHLPVVHSPPLSPPPLKGLVLCLFYLHSSLDGSSLRVPSSSLPHSFSGTHALSLSSKVFLVPRAKNNCQFGSKSDGTT